MYEGLYVSASGFETPRGRKITSILPWMNWVNYCCFRGAATSATKSQQTRTSASTFSIFALNAQKLACHLLHKCSHR